MKQPNWARLKTWLRHHERTDACKRSCVRFAPHRYLARVQSITAVCRAAKAMHGAMGIELNLCLDQDLCEDETSTYETWLGERGISALFAHRDLPTMNTTDYEGLGGRSRMPAGWALVRGGWVKFGSGEAFRGPLSADPSGSLLLLLRLICTLRDTRCYCLLCMRMKVDLSIPETAERERRIGRQAQRRSGTIRSH